MATYRNLLWNGWNESLEIKVDWWLEIETNRSVKIKYIKNRRAINFGFGLIISRWIIS